MSLSKKGSQTTDMQLNLPNKAPTLNPNAAEFVPFSLRSSSSPSRTASDPSDPTVRFVNSRSIGKAVLDHSESSVSNASDDDASQFWRHQLPDDITPDFKVMREDESQGFEGISLSALSLHDAGEMPRFPVSASAGSVYILPNQQEPYPRQINGSSFGEKMRYATCGEDATSGSFLNVHAKPWEKQVVNHDQILVNGKEVHHFDGNPKHGLMSDLRGEHGMVDDMDVSPVEFLASQFPGFAAESLAEVYFSNGCDLNLTIEMLTQLELQVDGGFNQNMNSKTLSSSNRTVMDFPTIPDGQNTPKYVGDNIQQSGNPYRTIDKDNMVLFKSSVSGQSRGATDFTSAGRKLAQDSSLWKYDRNGSAQSVGSSRSSYVLASAYNSGHGRNTYSERLQSRGSARAVPTLLETGEAVAKMYSEMREDARDNTRLRNVYFEQARQAYFVGNKALAKELNVKGQLHNMHVKSTHVKAQESIYRQRNPVVLETEGNGRGHECMIDLQGLHVSEAIHLLKHELTVIRSTARATDQRLQVYICIGTGHHTRGSRTPARLPLAVQRYLLEEESLDYSEPQPGLLRVVVY